MLVEPGLDEIPLIIYSRTCSLRRFTVLVMVNSETAAAIAAGSWVAPARSRSALAGVLVAISLTLVLVSWATLAFEVPHFEVGSHGHRLMNVGVEANIPTWWSAMLLAVAGLSLLVAAAAVFEDQRTAGMSAAIMGLLITAMSVDELSSIHEQLFYVAQRISHVFTFNWLVLGLPIGGAVLLIAAFTMKNLPPVQRRYIGIGLVVFFTGALGFEMISSMMAASGDHLGPVGTAVYHGEEFLEMTGASLMAAGALTPRR